MSLNINIDNSYEEELEKNKEDLLKGLDEYQKEAVSKPINKNVLCNSIAGSGKTHVLTRRVGYLIEQGVQESSILLLTFTNKAAKEMTERVASMLGKQQIYIKSGTFHSIASKYLRTYSSAIGFNKRFTILDMKDATSLINEIRTEELEKRKIGKRNFLSGKKIIDLHSNSINLQKDISEFDEIKGNNLELVRLIIDRYEKEKVEYNLMDFDDLLINFNRILEIEEVRKNIQEEIGYVLIDEYQDINHLQDSIIKHISNMENVFAVGDPSQSIYGFRGSDIKYIKNFVKEYNADEVNIKINYRSDKNILMLAEKAINNNKQTKYIDMIPFKESNYQQKYKKYKSSDTETEGVVSQIEDLIKDGVNPGDICILVRSTFSPIYKIEKELRKRDINYELRAGFSYFEKEHIKDLISILTLIANPSDKISFSRVMGLITGIGLKTGEKIFDFYKEHNYSFNSVSDNIDDLKVSAKIKSNLKVILDMYIDLEDITLVKEKIQFINNTFYKDYLFNKFYGDESYDDRYMDIISFTDISDTTDLDAFLEEIVLDTDVLLEEDIEEEKIVISTIHRSKGLEWPHVFIPFLNMGIYPRRIDQNIEEERRLFYVSLTRAEQVLYLSNSSYSDFDNALLEDSIFLEEIIFNK